jgi:tetratricopeptide (TPR) repeat protein
MRVNFANDARLERWTYAASQGGTLSELLLTLGDVGPAVAAARESVAYADKRGDAFQRMARRTTLADALHQAGGSREAATLFAEAERLQKEWQPELPRLYSVRGYRLCDLLLGQGRHAEVAERAGNSIELARRYKWLLDIALDTLSLGRAAHQASRAASGLSPSPRLRGEGRGEGQPQTPAHVSAPHPNPLPADEQGEGITARRHLDGAVEGLRKAGDEEMVARGLLARAAFRRDTGEWDKAQEDLDEAYEIASRGGMRLFLADYHLERARLLLAQLPQPTVERSWFGGNKTTAPVLTPQQRTILQDAEQVWKEANALIQATGYHRRDRDLTELRTALDGHAA